MTEELYSNNQKNRIDVRVAGSTSLTPAMSSELLYSCETEGGRSTPSPHTQTALDERTESFVPKTKPNLCQTNELKRPT